MDMTWGKILVGVALAMCLLGVGALEVLTERGPGRRALSESPAVGDGHDGPWGEMGRAAPALTAETDVAAPAMRRDAPTTAPSRRLTVLEVNEPARQLVSRTGTGRVLVTDLARDPFVVTQDSGAGSLALLQPGDVVQIEPAEGRSQRIVVLRHAER